MNKLFLSVYYNNQIKRKIGFNIDTHDVHHFYCCKFKYTPLRLKIIRKSMF